MISEKYIMDLLRGFANSAEGKRYVEKLRGKAIDNSREFVAVEAGNYMKELLLSQIDPLIPSFPEWGITVGAPSYDSAGNLTVDLYVNDKAVHRDSLYPAKYGDGLKNIIQLFVTGYQPLSHPIFGTWHHSDGSPDTWTRGLPERAPDSFLKDALESFNATYAKEGIKAKFVGSYDGIIR